MNDKPTRPERDDPELIRMRRMDVRRVRNGWTVSPSDGRSAECWVFTDAHDMASFLEHGVVWAADQ